jgi:hypothetical protein
MISVTMVGTIYGVEQIIQHIHPHSGCGRLLGVLRQSKSDTLGTLGEQSKHNHSVILRQVTRG